MEEYYYFSYDIDNGMFLGFLIPEIHGEKITEGCNVKINKELWSKLQQIDCIINLDSVLGYIPNTVLTLKDFNDYFIPMDFSTPIPKKLDSSGSLMREIGNEKIKNMKASQLETQLLKMVADLKIEIMKIKGGK